MYNLGVDQYGEIVEAIEYIRGVFPIDSTFDALVNGADDWAVDSHTIDGDDLAGACHHLNVLMKIFNVK